MATNFPDSPSVNDTHTVGDKTWTWDGTVWSVVTGGVPTSISELTITNDLTVDTNTLHVDSTNNRVGIATTSPQTPLGVDGDVDVVGVSRSIVFGRQSEVGPHGLEVWSSGSLESAVYYRTTPDSWSFENSSADKIMVVDIPNERVGIGTDSPSYALDVAGDIHIQSAAPYLIFTDTDTSAESRISANSSQGSLLIDADYNNEVADTNIIFRSDGSEKMRIDSSGNVGIGTTSPGSALHIAGASIFQVIVDDADYVQIANRYSSNDILELTSYGSMEFAIDSNNNSSSKNFTWRDGGEHGAGSALMTLSDTGYLGVGVSNPDAQPGAEARLYAYTNSNVPVFSVESATTTTTSVLAKGYSNVSGTDIIQFVIRTDGDFESRTNSYGATSDVAIKQDIVDAPSQWDDIKAVQLRKFRFIEDVNENGEDAQVMLGVIAQELEAAGMGGLVAAAAEDEPVLDENGEPTGEVTNDKPYKSVKYSVLLLKALGALQEAMARIEALEAN